jgi:hypothetical protein
LTQEIRAYSGGPVRIDKAYAVVQTILPQAAGVLVDPFAGSVDYVRMPVADRRNLRCTYRMIEHMKFMSLETVRQELQSYQSHFAWHGGQLF